MMNYSFSHRQRLTCMPCDCKDFLASMTKNASMLTSTCHINRHSTGLHDFMMEMWNLHTRIIVFIYLYGIVLFHASAHALYIGIAVSISVIVHKAVHCIFYLNCIMPNQHVHCSSALHVRVYTYSW